MFVYCGRIPIICVFDFSCIRECPTRILRRRRMCLFPQVPFVVKRSKCLPSLVPNTSISSILAIVYIILNFFFTASIVISLLENKNVYLFFLLFLLQLVGRIGTNIIQTKWPISRTREKNLRVEISSYLFKMSDLQHKGCIVVLSTNKSFQWHIQIHHSSSTFKFGDFDQKKVPLAQGEGEIWLWIHTHIYSYLFHDQCVYLVKNKYLKHGGAHIISYTA